MKSKPLLLAGVRFSASDISLVASLIHDRLRVIEKFMASEKKSIYENCDAKFMITGARENEGARGNVAVHYNKRRVYKK